jgi:hypothetical protein
MNRAKKAQARTPHKRDAIRGAAGQDAGASAFWTFCIFCKNRATNTNYKYIGTLFRDFLEIRGNLGGFFGEKFLFGRTQSEIFVNIPYFPPFLFQLSFL